MSSRRQSNLPPDVRSRIMRAIRGRDTKPELMLRAALWKRGVRGWRCHYPECGTAIDIAFTRWRVAVFVDGSFWHGHPSKWVEGRLSPDWDDRIRKNRARDERVNRSLEEAGWRVLRFWEFEIDRGADAVAERVATELASLRRRTGRPVRRDVASLPPRDASQ